MKLIRYIDLRTSLRPLMQEASSQEGERSPSLPFLQVLDQLRQPS